MPEPVQHRMVEATDGTKLSFHWRPGQSDVEPLLAIPGLGMPADIWFGVLDQIDPARPVAVIEPRGSGRSGPIGGDVDGSVFAADAVRILDELGWACAHIGGISMGGMIAQRLAVLHGSRVMSLTLVCTYARPGPWTTLVWNLRQSLAECPDPFQQRLAAALFLTGPTMVEQNPTIIDTLMGLWTTSPPSADSYRQQMKFCATYDFLDDLQQLDLPGLVISGGRDLLCTPRAGEELAQALRGRYVCIPDATHLLTSERPAELAILLDEHLTANDTMSLHRDGV